MAGFQNFTSRVLSLVSARVLKLAVAFAATPFVVRLLEPDGYGNYAVVLSVFTFWMLPVSSAVTEGVQKFVGEARGDGDDWRAGVLQFYVGFGGVLVSASVALLVAFTYLGGAAWLFGDAFTLYFYLLAAHVFVSQFRAIGYHAVLGLGREGATATFDVTRKVLTVGVGIALVAWTELGVAGMLVGHVAANFVVALAAGVVLLRAVGVGSLARPRVKGLPWRELVSFNLLNVVLVVLVRSMAHVDVVMLRAFTGASTTGFYKAALSTAEYIWLVPMALQAALLHSSSSLWNEGRTDEITAVATRVTRYTLLLVVIMAIGMAVLVDRFVPLYFGDAFGESVLPLLVLLPGVVGFAAARPLQAISQGSGRLRTLLYAVGGAAGLNLALNAALIPQYGMLGAAAATSVGYASMFGFLVWTAYRLGFDPLADVRAGRIVATAVLTAPVVWGVDRLVAGALLAAPVRWGLVDGAANAVLSLAVVPPVGLLAYLAIAVQVGALDLDELHAIADKAPGPVGGSLRTALSWVD